MKTYEITFITIEDKNLSIGGPAKEIIESLGGQIIQVSSMGQKQFAYPIKKENRGFYTTVIFELDPANLSQLDRRLTLQEEILRHLTIRFEGELPKISLKPQTPVVKKEEKKETEVKEVEVEVEEEPKEEVKIAEEVEEPKTEEPKAEEPKAEEPAAEKVEETEEKTEETSKPVKEEMPKPEVKEEKKVSKRKKPEPIAEPETEEERLAELDKKLDELLKD